jgi:SAM-dependent methyltransferase
VREFSADYLRTTRSGMWADSRAALSALELDTRHRVLDVGCGTGAFTAVLREECPGVVVGCDADGSLLAAVDPPVVRGDAVRLPFADGAFDLVVCQALLINLPDPAAAVAEFARVSSDLVAVVEPDNGAVTVESTVDSEASLAERARDLYLDGVKTDVTLGAGAETLLSAADLTVVATDRYDHDRRIEPPYSKTAVESARRKVTGEGLDSDRDTMRAAGATPEQLAALRDEWREMGRVVVEQMQSERYRRREVVPFYVSVGRV